MTSEERGEGIRHLLVQAPEQWEPEVWEWLAETLHFRVQSTKLWSTDRLVDAASRASAPRSGMVEAAMIALHVHSRVPLLSAFLDALGLPHVNGLITADSSFGPDRMVGVASAADQVESQFPIDEVVLYFLCLLKQQDHALADLAPWLLARAAESEDLAGTTETQLPRASVAPASSDAGANTAIPNPQRLDGFTTLDRRIVMTIVDSVRGVAGAPSEDEMDDILNELVSLNGRRHQGFFHEGFRDALCDRIRIDSTSADNVSRRRWYFAGYVVGLAREARWEEIAELHDTESSVRSLGTSESLGETDGGHRFGPALHAGWLIFLALCRADRHGEATRGLGVDVIHASPQLRRELLAQATQLIRDNRASDARGMLDVLWAVRTLDLSRSRMRTPPTSSRLNDAEHSACDNWVRWRRRASYFTNSHSSPIAKSGRAP